MKKLIFIFIIFLFASCEKDFFDENYRYLYGDWVPVQLSSGMNYASHPELLGDIIQILKKGSYNVIRNDKTAETGVIEIETQTMNKLSVKFVPKELDFGSDSFIRLSHSSLNVVTFTQDSIRFHNNAVDGGHFSLWLKRKN
jgi:hypothetical protein